MDRQQDVPGSTTLICLWFNDFTNCQISCRISVKYLWSILCKLPCPGYFVTDKWSYDNSSLIQSVNLLGFHAFNWLWFVYINKIVRWKRVHALDNCQLSRWARIGMSEQVSTCQDIWAAGHVSGCLSRWARVKISCKLQRNYEGRGIIN